MIARCQSARPFGAAKRLFRLAKLAVRALLSEADGSARGFPGHRFGLFGRGLGVRMAAAGYVRIGIGLALTPVNCVRYWEFDFADRHLKNAGGLGLDVSSPRLLSLYLAHRGRFERIRVCNPDENDLVATRHFVEVCGMDRIEIRRADAAAAVSDRSGYSAIWSISVVEHIPGEDGDAAAVEGMFRALEPGGRLILTIPTDRRAWTEYRRDDTYTLGLESERDGSYFFQRYYDLASIQSRLIASVGIPPTSVEWFGELRPGVFTAYEREWIRTGQDATVRDPSFIARNFTTYGSWEEMPGMGVCGLVFEAPRRHTPSENGLRAS